MACCLPVEQGQAFITCLVRLAIALHCCEPTLLAGPTGCKKTVVQTWAQIMGLNEELMTAFLTQDTDASELLGQIQPFTLHRCLAHVLDMAQGALDRFTALVHAEDPATTRLREGADHDISAAQTVLIRCVVPLGVLCSCVWVGLR